MVAALADTTATNFGQWSGAITILQVESFYHSVLHHIPYPISEMLGYPVVVIPSGHQVQVLIPKHETRLLSGRATTGPGEVLFLKFYNAQNQIHDLIRPDTVLKKFDWNQYEGTSIEELGFLIKRWSQR